MGVDAKITLWNSKAVVNKKTTTKTAASSAGLTSENNQPAPPPPTPTPTSTPTPTPTPTPTSCSKGSKLFLKVDQTTGSVVLPSNLTSGAAKNLDCKDNWHKGYLGSIPVECKLGVLRFSGSKKHSCKQYDPCSKDEDDCAGDGHICTHTGPGSHKCSCGSNRYG